MFNLIVAGLVLPLVASLLLARRPRKPAGGWMATFVLAAGMVAFGFFTVPWGFLGMPLRYTVGGLFVVSLVVSLLRRPDERAEDTPTRMMLKILIGLFFGSVALGVIRAYSVPPGAVDVAFPLAGGRYTVVHGGSTTAANTYFGRKEPFAADVVGFKPGEVLISPCDGTIVAARPLQIRCAKATITLSAEAKQGGAVKRGAEIGTVSAPVLHISGDRPLTFDGRWLVRNAVIR